MIDEKQDLRKRVANLKKEFTKTELVDLSERVIENLSNLEVFKNANNVLLYYSMPDEVNTKSLIDQINNNKQIILPIVEKTGLILKKYISEELLITSKYGIREPVGDLYVDYDDIDIVIVPGVAFDRTLSRMGRGKGYYDGLLPKIKAAKVAICFDFQLFDYVPSNDKDIKMDMIVCESEVIQ